MIEIESRELADIPVLHAYPVGQKDTPLLCAIFYHGFTSSSLVYSYFAVALATWALALAKLTTWKYGSRHRTPTVRSLPAPTFGISRHVVCRHVAAASRTRKPVWFIP